VGGTHPPHEGLSQLFDRDAAAHMAELRELVGRTPQFEKIKTVFSHDAAGEAAWTGGPINAIDTALLYHFVAKYRPKTYLEIGSGVTTLFAARAKADHALSTRIVSIDPNPRAEVDAQCDEVIRTPFELSDLTVFDRLEPGDIVFMDGSHRTFMNSDVTVFMLDVLPKLKPGVIVHVHDIVLPYDYPDSFTGWYWNEQYILGAYLLGAADRVKVLMPSRYCAAGDAGKAILRPLATAGWAGTPDVWEHGGSIWFTHTAGPVGDAGLASARRFWDGVGYLAARMPDDTFVPCRLNGVDVHLSQPTLRIAHHCTHPDGGPRVNLFIETAHFEWLRDRLRPGDTFLDVGAATGTMAVPMAAQFGNAVRVAAFEPARTANRVLRATVARNSLGNVEVIDAAVSDAPGTARFAEYPQDETGETPYLPETSALDSELIDHGRTVGYDVAVTTLDTFLAGRKDADRARVLKIDVEGFEAKVLDGAREYLRRVKPFISIDIHRDPFNPGETTEPAVRERLAPLGYQFEKLGHALTCTPLG
jgi:FkbM family methyltransferase